MERCGGIRSRRSGARTRGEHIRGPARPQHGAAHPGWFGWPGRRRAVDRRRRARPARRWRRSTASAMLRRQVPPKSRQAARARLSRSSSRTSTFRCGRRRRRRASRGVVEDVAADVGEGLGLPLPGRAVVVGGARPRVRVDDRGDRVEHGGVVEPALDPAPPAGPRVRYSSLIWAGGRSSGSAPSWSSVSTSAAPQACSSAGRSRRPCRQLVLGARPLLGREPPRGSRVRVPARPPRPAAGAPARPANSARGGGQPCRQRRAVEPHPSRGLLGHRPLTPGLARSQPSRSAERRPTTCIPSR